LPDPHVELVVDRRSDNATDGEADDPHMLYVDGELWPVERFKYEIANERQGALLTFSIRGSLRIREREEGE
jgi:hypothetical protein